MSSNYGNTLKSTYPHLDWILAPCGYVQASFNVSIFFMDKSSGQWNFFLWLFLFCFTDTPSPIGFFNTTNRIFFHGQVFWSMEFFSMFFLFSSTDTPSIIGFFNTTNRISFTYVERTLLLSGHTEQLSFFFICVTMDAPRNLSFPYLI
jgi:hypothetical protein